LGLAFLRAQDQPTLDSQDPLTIPHSSLCLILQKTVPLPPPTVVIIDKSGTKGTS